MAKNLREVHPNSGDDDQSEELRVSNRAAIIKKACQEITQLQLERSKISAEISAIKLKLVKSDLGMKISDFSAALRLFQTDDDRRSEFLDTLHETFAALGVGGQLDFMRAFDHEGRD